MTSSTKETLVVYTRTTPNNVNAKKGTDFKSNLYQLEPPPNGHWMEAIFPMLSQPKSLMSFSKHPKPGFRCQRLYVSIQSSIDVKMGSCPICLEHVDDIKTPTKLWCKHRYCDTCANQIDICMICRTVRPSPTKDNTGNIYACVEIRAKSTRSKTVQDLLCLFLVKMVSRVDGYILRSDLLRFVRNVYYIQPRETSHAIQSLRSTGCIQCVNGRIERRVILQN